MSLDNVSDQDIVECLQNCPELDGPLFDVNVLDDLCLSDELWANLDLVGTSLPTDASFSAQPQGFCSENSQSQKVVEDFPGVVTPPYSPPTNDPSSPSSVTMPPSSVAAPPTFSAPQPHPQPMPANLPQASLPTTSTAQQNAATVVSPQSKPVSHQITSTGPQKPLPLSKQQPIPSTNLDTGAQLTSLCQQIGLPHFNGSLQVLKSGEVVRVQPVPQGAATTTTSAVSHTQPSKQAVKDAALQLTNQVKQEQPVVGQKRQRSPESTLNPVDMSKLTKKQQRMIKNRESACLSRQKKRQYVDALEARLKEAALKNSALLQENTSLRKQVSLLEQENESLRLCVSNPSSPSSSTPSPSSSLTSFSSLRKPSMVMMLILCFSCTALYYNRGLLQVPHSSTTALTHVKSRALLSIDNDNSVSRYERSSSVHPAPSSRALVPVSAEVSSELEERLKRLRLQIGEELEQAQQRQQHQQQQRVCSCPHNHTKKMNETNVRLINEEMTSCFKLNSIHNSAPAYYSTHDILKNSLTILNPDHQTPQPSYLVDGPERLYQSFKKFIPRDLENYYLLSFKDHILLHPPVQNSSHFPYLSVLLPADSDYTSLLQVDCEVTAAKIIQRLQG